MLWVPGRLTGGMDTYLGKVPYVRSPIPFSDSGLARNNRATGMGHVSGACGTPLRYWNVDVTSQRTMRLFSNEATICMFFSSSSLVDCPHNFPHVLFCSRMQTEHQCKQNNPPLPWPPKWWLRIGELLSLPLSRSSALGMKAIIG